MSLTPKKLKSTHEGKITLGDLVIPCAVLTDGTRVISYSAVFKAFGRTKRGTQDDRRVPDMPAFLNANNLQPFVSNDLKGVLDKIDYTDKNGKGGQGFDANILPLLCKLYLDARAAEKLVKSQLPLARASEILLLALSKIGIIALVDEATGYQYERERSELQAIIQLYIETELQPWQKRFPDEFYKEIFRLRGWQFTVKNIKAKPGVIGKWTKDLIYKQLPKGVMTELYDQTPKTESGKLATQLHRSLTIDVGHPHLNRQIISVVTLMNISKNWAEFLKFFKKKFDPQQELNFGEDTE